MANKFSECILGKSTVLSPSDNVQFGGDVLVLDKSWQVSTLMQIKMPLKSLP